MSVSLDDILKVKLSVEDVAEIDPKAPRVEDDEVIYKRVTDDWTIEEIARFCPPHGWRSLFKHLETEFERVDAELRRCAVEGIAVFPSRVNIFDAFRLVGDIDSIRVVIIGQDPYPRRGHANGVAFSCDYGIPPSVANVFKELKRELGDEFAIPKHADLTRWCQRGVFMLNTTLTVMENDEKHSHRYIWEPITSRIVSYISTRNKNIVYMLWGNFAKAMANNIKSSAAILTASHPSPKSANFGYEPFMGCNHFAKANQILGDKAIDWNV